MQLENGKYYVTRDGTVVGPIYHLSDREYGSDDILDNYMPVWKSDGLADFFFDDMTDEKYDIVAEHVRDEPQEG